MKTIAAITTALVCSLYALDVTNNVSTVTEIPTNFPLWVSSHPTNDWAIESSNLFTSSNDWRVASLIRYDAEIYDGVVFEIEGRGYTNTYVLTAGHMVLQ